MRITTLFRRLLGVISLLVCSVLFEEESLPVGFREALDSREEVFGQFSVLRTLIRGGMRRRS